MKLSTSDRDWLEEAGRLFSVSRPAHFTDYRHCCECAEHDETLLANDIDTIGLTELGNPGWDPLCFCSGPGLLYYTPALIRLSLNTVEDDFYFSQLLFHLDYGGRDNRYLQACSDVQRKFIADFVDFMILTYTEQLSGSFDEDTALRVSEVWSEAAGEISGSNSI